MFGFLLGRKTNKVIWQSAKYTLYHNGVVQDEFAAKVLSAKEIISTYRTPAADNSCPKIYFKFSLNGLDNEMEYGKNHVLHCLGPAASYQTPIITFGHQFVDQTPLPEDAFMAPNTTIRIKLDLRPVLTAFYRQGYYTTFNGETIRKEDFRGVYVAGSVAPLTWNFADLTARPTLELKDPDHDGIYELTLVLNKKSESKALPWRWQQIKDTSAFPQYKSDYPVANALYNMALEELIQAVEADGTFRTGKEWAGVWTRDISYSIILALAALQPKVSQTSLMRKVKNGRVVQDTGTGGAYPISTDRLIWAIAAWEIYKVTRDQIWLRNSYQIIKYSLQDDLHNIYDTQTGLVRGESSFLDWREQTYPAWMQPSDIYLSQCLSTNAIHYRANKVVMRMARLLQDEEAAEKHKQIALGLKKSINQYLWMPRQGYYGQYRYGRNYKILSGRAEALGEALCVLFGIAGKQRQKKVIQNTPVHEFGISCIFPQIPGVPPYHNKAVWPFVQAYWSLAAAKAGNEAALTQSISAIYRPAALFLTNKENFVLANGDYGGTQINSDNMLWSLAGNLSTIYKIFFGLHFRTNCLEFRPFVPQAFRGRHQLYGFRYRNAILNLQIEGYGNSIESITLDGELLPEAKIPGNLEGKHEVKIRLKSVQEQKSQVNNQPYQVSPDMPIVSLTENKLWWQPIKEANYYCVLKNGQAVFTTYKTEYKITAGEYAEYQVLAINAAGYESFASEPVLNMPPDTVHYCTIETNNAQGFLDISRNKHTHLQLPVNIIAAGTYALDFWYANGNGPIETDNKCAFRALKVGNNQIGTIVMPQRGANNWSEWGYTNAVVTYLEKGKYSFSLAFEPMNENMNGEVNQALIEHLRLRKLS